MNEFQEIMSYTCMIFANKTCHFTSFEEAKAAYYLYKEREQLHAKLYKIRRKLTNVEYRKKVRAKRNARLRSEQESYRRKRVRLDY